MAIIATAKSGNYTPISSGAHLAACISIVDLGEQLNDFNGKMQRRVMLTWEVPDDTISTEEGEVPRVISKEYTTSLSDKATLRAHLEAWRGRKFTDTELAGFDLKNVLGKACQINVIHNEKGYANINGVMAVPKGMPAPALYHELLYFDLTDPACLGQMDKLPAWVQDKIKKSVTYKELAESAVDTSTEEFTPMDDDEALPF